MYISGRALGRTLGVCHAFSVLLNSINLIPIYVEPIVRVWNNNGKMYGVYHSLRTRIFKQIST